MLKEFALDPELLGNWKDFRFFTAECGVAKGRLISRFPANWEERVKEAAKSAKEVEFLRIIEALSRIKALMFTREYRNYDKGLDWLRNAIEENGYNPFHAIVSTRHDGTTPNLIVGSEIDPTNPPELWAMRSSLPIVRTAMDMVSCAKMLLAQCDEVIFVDPYFGPGKKEHTVPLRDFLHAIASRGKRRMPSRLEYHCGNQDLGIVAFQSNLERWVKPALPPHATLTVVRWNKTELHNRYILTDRGGVMFGHGLDQADGDAGGHDTVAVLDQQTCEQRMIDYSDKSKLLSWLGEKFTVTGT